MTAGTEYSFFIQSRDFYSNNKAMTLEQAISSDYLITYTNEDGQTKVQALLEDHTSDGVFIASFTLTKTGHYTLQILLRGLEVPTYLTDTDLTVVPYVTSAVTSEFEGNLLEYKTGDYITIKITARDEFNNLRGSTDD